MVDLDLEYNTERKALIIPEYGRAIHKMVDYCVSLANKEERNKCARSIIAIMGNLFPHLRDTEDYRHKLWDHLFIMSGFQLDVDSPYPLPTIDTLQSKPEKVEYPKGDIKYGHYGRVTQQFIEKAVGMSNEEEKERTAIQLFLLMKRSYKSWNGEHVDDSVILAHMRELSKGQLILDPAKVEGLSDHYTPAPVSGGQNNKKKKWGKNFKNKRRNTN